MAAASRRALAATLLAATVLPMGAAPVAAAPSGVGDSRAQGGCLEAKPPAHTRPAQLRFGVDPGPAGDLTPGAPLASPITARRAVPAIAGLAGHKPIVVRLNRLFWSGGRPLLARFARRARAYSRAGDDVEVQVRYHPTQAERGRIGRWAHWVRLVTRRLSANRRLTGLTITNEVNFPVSPNTSDGAYPKAERALIRGVEAAHSALVRHHRAHRVRVGFTFAYRFAPDTDEQFFERLRSQGGPRFRRALGFVGIDDYPGTVYPPSLPPGDTAGNELAIAVATMRVCYLPLAAIPRRVPLWITENGFPSSKPAHSDAKQCKQLVSMVSALHRIAGTEHVTDYRWFTLRDNDSNGSGTFDQVGLLTDHWRPKPAYEALRKLIRRFGR